MQSRKKILTGLVTSDKMTKTIVVKVESSKKHLLYEKSFKVYKKFKAHDEKEAASSGDTVRIVESRPYSKEKKFRLLDIVTKVKA